MYQNYCRNRAVYNCPPYVMLLTFGVPGDGQPCKQNNQLFSVLCLDEDCLDLWLSLQITNLLSFQCWVSHPASCLSERLLVRVQLGCNWIPGLFSATCTQIVSIFSYWSFLVSKIVSLKSKIVMIIILKNGRIRVIRCTWVYRIRSCARLFPQN